jgi:hypothetical protein
VIARQDVVKTTILERGYKNEKNDEEYQVDRAYFGYRYADAIRLRRKQFPGAIRIVRWSGGGNIGGGNTSFSAYAV